MKTIIYIGITGALLTAGPGTQAQQFADSRSYRNDDAGLVINNYYNYDFYYSSRINRFHRSYTTFSYYSPVFTDTYWYSYQPYTWGLTIYGGGRIGVGIAYNYPVYYRWDYPWYAGWDYGWYGGAWYWNYDPFYYSWWYSPVVININVGSWWPHTRYYSYNVRHRWYNDYRPVYNTYNYYYYNNTVGTGSGASSVSRRTTPPVTTTSGSVNRRETGTVNPSGSTATEGNAGAGRRVTPVNSRERTGDMGNNNSLNPGNTYNVNRGVNSGNNPGRRNVPAGNPGNQNGNIHQGDQGNNNSANPGNTNNVNRGVNSGNNPGQGNVNNDRYNNGQINQGQGNARPSVTTPSQERRTYGTVNTPSVNTRPATGNSGTSTRVQEGSRPSVSSGSRTTVSSTGRQTSGNAAVRSVRSSGNTQGNVSKAAPSRSTSVQKSESKSSSRKSSSNENSGSRRK